MKPCRVLKALLALTCTLAWLGAWAQTPLVEDELIELVYADGVRKPIQAKSVSDVADGGCGQQPHRLITQEGGIFCGTFYVNKMSFFTAQEARRVTQHLGQKSFDGYAVPSDRTALFNYELIQTPDRMRLNYSLMANQSPGFQWVASRNGSITQGHALWYDTAIEQHDSKTNLAVRQQRLGQMVLDSGPLSSALGLGFEWRKASSFNQANVQVFNGRLVNQTELTVLVNNEPRATVQAQAGDVSVYNVPLLEGNNQVTVLYRNENGELVQTSRQVFFSQNLLAKGQWNGSASVYQDQRLRHWAAQAQAEWGATQALTVQGGLRANISADSNKNVVMLADGRTLQPRPVEAAVALRGRLGAGFVSAGAQTPNTFGPGIQRLGWAVNTHLFFLEKALGPARLGWSFEPAYFMDQSPEWLKGLRLGVSTGLSGPERELTVSKGFASSAFPGAYFSAFCKTGTDRVGLDQHFCGLNANMALGDPGSPFQQSRSWVAGVSMSQTGTRAMDPQNQVQTRESQNLNAFLQSRDTSILVSNAFSFVRTRHDFDRFSVQAQYDQQGRLLTGVSGAMALDYQNGPKVLALLPNDPFRPNEVLVSVEGLQPAKDMGYAHVQTRINGKLSSGGVNNGALLGQVNDVLINPASVSMESDMPFLRLKLAPALPGVYRVTAHAE